MAVLRYDDVRAQDDQQAALLNFLQSVYDQSAALAQWPVEQFQHAPDQP